MIVFDLNSQNRVIWRYENALINILNVAKIMAVTSCAGKHFLLLYYGLSMTDFHELFPCSQNSNYKQQQYCNTVRPQLNSGRFTQHMT